MHREKGFMPFKTGFFNRQRGWFVAGGVRRNLSNGAGFTLIELLVVISVIVLLMAILLPALRRVRKQAKAVVCQANLRQWGTALSLYMEDSQGYLPTNYRLIFGGSSLGKDDPNGPEPCNPIDTKGINFCPTAVRSGPEVPRTFQAWDVNFHDTLIRGSYGFNDYLFGPYFDKSTNIDTPDIFSLRGRANIPTLLDAYWHSGRPLEIDSPPSTEAFGYGFGLGGIFCINRHNGHVNSLFLDWSVRKVGLKELWTLKWDREFDTEGTWTRAGGVQPENWPQWMRKFKDY